MDERREILLSDKQIEQIASRAKELALEELYIAVGKSVIRKALWTLGLGIAAVTAWYQGLFKVGN